MSEMIEAPMSATEIAVVEANAVARGIPLDQLMENAGRAVAEEVQKRVPPAPARVAIVAGPGNNGGDGSAAAFHLAQWGHAVEVWMLLPPTEIRSPWARRCFERVAGRVPVHTTPVTAPQLSEFAVVVDAMLGSGQSGPLRAPYREAVAAIRASGIPVLSIDVPTGLHDPEGLRPRWTIALTALKEGMSPASCGEITVREIGIPLEARIETGPGDFLYYPSPSRRGRRGRAGRLVIVGGGPYAGAPALAAMAALRSGAERATVFAPRPAADRVQGFSPNLVVRAVGEERFERRDVRAIRNALYAAPPKAVLIGMGAGRAPETVEALGELIE
ncbi:MAG TPA: NAD(P)H-hydrate epimerase, partial [Thermoplasmata archaeon]|nr:NAD(P)H-hydrate epimerase [Thermoplasmata archaeon]